MKTYDLTNWLFKKGSNPEAFQKDFVDIDWESITVPHDWSILGGFSKDCSSGTGYLPGGEGWYRCHVDLKTFKNLEEKHCKLIFDGIYKNAQIWVNGYHCTYRPSGYASIVVDISEILSYAVDDDLVICVQVMHKDLADSRWYNGTGITRSVKLEVHEKVYIETFGTTFVVKQVEENRADISIKHQIVNDTGEAVSLKVINQLESVESKKRHDYEQMIEILPYQKKEVILEGVILQPELWSPQSPVLYELKTELHMENQVNVYKEYVGVRTFSFTPNDGFYLNGISEKIKGVCLHEDAGCFGTAVPVEVWTRRLLKLKEMGCNAIRMAHNPHAMELYALCDLLGFLVFDEAFDEWENPKNKWWQGHNVYPPKHEGYAEFFPNWYKEDLENMILRNRNRPSIIAWSIGNEVDYPNDPYVSPLFKEMTGNNDANKPSQERVYNPAKPDIRRLTTISKKLAEIVRQIDPTRPVTLAAAFPELSAKTGLLDALDVVGYNYKEFLYEEDHLRFPEKPFIGSENGHGYLQWKTVEDLPYISGQFLWTGIDYLGESRREWPMHGSDAGFLDIAGFEKENYYLRKSWWANKPFVYLCAVDPTEGSGNVSRSWDYPIEERIEVRCYTNLEKENLKIVYEGALDGSMDYDHEKGYYSFKVNYTGEPIRIMYEGKIADELKATSEACQLMVAEWEIPKEIHERLQKMSLVNEAKIYQIECFIKDDSNQIVTNKEEILRVTVANGKLLGLENGDLSDVTSYTESYRRTKNGRLILFIQSKEVPEVEIESETYGKIQVKLKR